MSDAVDRAWKALADPTRRTILDRLQDGPRTTGDLCRFFQTSRFAVMKHLDVLAAAGLVVAERRGRERWNHLDPAPLRLIERWIGPHLGQRPGHGPTLRETWRERERPASAEAPAGDWNPGID